MYMPTLDVILTELKLSREQIADGKAVTIPANLFRFLLQVVLLDSEFNESGYLAVNPDIRQAVATGMIEDPRLHYVWTGYFEGGHGATPEVDEEWYLRTYPDVAAAVEAGAGPPGAAYFCPA